MSRPRVWTDEELEFIRANYRDLGARACADHLGHDIKRVYEKAHEMGVSRTHTFERAPRVAVPPPDHPAVLKPESPRTSAVYDSGFIRPPSLKRLMSGR